MKQIVLYVKCDDCIVAMHATKDPNNAQWVIENGRSIPFTDLGSSCWLNVMVAKNDMKRLTGANRYYKHVTPSGRPVWRTERDYNDIDDAAEREWRKVR